MPNEHAKEVEEFGADEPEVKKPKRVKSVPIAETDKSESPSSDTTTAETSSDTNTPGSVSVDSAESGAAEEIDEFVHPEILNPEERFLKWCIFFDKLLAEEMKRHEAPNGTRLPAFFKSAQGEIKSLVAFLRKEVYGKK